MEIRRKILKKSEGYNNHIIAPKKRSSVQSNKEPRTLSKPEHNPEGLLEVQIKHRT